MRGLFVGGVILACGLAGAARAEDKPRDLSFVVVPIPVSNPALGNGLAVAALALYKAGGSDRPWTTGAGGVYTDSKSWAVALGQKAYIDDRFRLTAGGGVGEFNIDFYGIGQAANGLGRSIPITAKSGAGVFEFLTRVAPNLYAGFEYRFARVDTTYDFSQVPDPILNVPDKDLKSTTSLLGLSGEYDTRDNEYQPGRGWYITGRAMRSAKAIGADDNYTRVEAAANRYWRLDDKSVLAARASVCWSGDGAPYYNLCAFGSQSDLRGYVSGQYLDHAMYAVQAEYRRHLFWRIGAAAFAGVGATGASFHRMSTEDLLPAAGLGLRFAASERYKVNVRFDYAWGKDSQTFYFSVGEAF